MTALFFCDADRTPAPPAQARNTLLRMLDAATESRLRAFHRAMGYSPVATIDDADGEHAADFAGPH